MIHFPVPEALTFDDVLLLPGRSDVVPANANTQTGANRAVPVPAKQGPASSGIRQAVAPAPGAQGPPRKPSSVAPPSPAPGTARPNTVPPPSARPKPAGPPPRPPQR